MLYRIKRELYRVRKFIARSHDNGLSLPYILLIHIPRVFISAVYEKLAKRINDRILSVTINRLLITLFHKKYAGTLRDHFYVIVMPNTLHYLIPCLRLLPEDRQVFLIFNGARSWERKLLIEQFKNRPTFKLVTLPRSSINHGEVINLFFSANNTNFGIIDHDLYIFDPEIFNQLTFTNDQCMKAIFRGENRFNGMSYPHTFFLFFNTEKLKQLMETYHVNAKIYKKIPPEIESRISKIGLSNSKFIKDYISFFDTLHVMLALAYVEDWKVDYINTKSVYHIGGTSMGSQYSKDISHMYMSMCFLELVNHPLLTKKYLPYLAPFTSSEQIQNKLPATPDVIHMKNTVHTILSMIKAGTEDSI